MSPASISKVYNFRFRLCVFFGMGRGACRYGWGLMRSNIPTQASSEVCAFLACLLTSNAIKTIFLDPLTPQKDFLSTL